MADQHSVKVDTSYIVLRETGDGAAFAVVGEVTAKSHDRAIRQHAEHASDPAGVYVAVPARSWNPLRVDTQTVTQLTLKADR